jgi:hypothetical protein
MERPRAPGAGTARAQISLRRGKSAQHVACPASAVQRLSCDVRLQAAFRRLWQIGPRPVATLIAEVVDLAGADAALLDLVFERSSADPAMIAATGADDWTPPLHVVPEDAA